MKAKLLTLAALAAMFVGGLMLPGTAEARPWRGYFGPYNEVYYYGRPAVRYYRTYPVAPVAAYRYPALRYYSYGPVVYGPRVYYRGPIYYPAPRPLYIPY